MSQRQTFAQKRRLLKDRARRSNEERNKLVTRIQAAVKKWLTTEVSIWW